MVGAKAGRQCMREKDGETETDDCWFLPFVLTGKLDGFTAQFLLFLMFKFFLKKLNFIYHL